ncbi:MAG: glycine cleavage system protein GcvH [Chloroflexi bacterium]|nr:glycine cleavage system protein GcvH [Chloroflexota bacterium]
MKILDNLFYSKNDEWVKIEGNKATLGISDYAQDALSDIVFVDISVSVGEELVSQQNIGSVESVKAAADIYTPVEGKVTAINQAMIDNPEGLNSDPYDKGWLLELSNDAGFDTEGLMDAAAYKKYIDERG